MAGHTKLFGLALTLIACSGGNDHETMRGLGTGRTADAAENDAEREGSEAGAAASEEAGASAVDAGAEPVADAAQAARDAASPVDAAVSDASSLDASGLDAAFDAGAVDTGAATGDAQPADAAQPDAALADTGSDAESDADVPPPDPDQPYWLRVIVDNPHDLPDPISFSWGAGPMQPDEDGYVYAQSLPEFLDVTLGGSDETLVHRFYGIESGDQLHFLYHFTYDRSAKSYRPIVLPSIPPDAGDIRVESSVGYEFVPRGQTTASVQFHMVGAAPYFARAAVGGAMLYAVSDVLEPPTALPFPAVVLGPWKTARTISVALTNASDQAGLQLFFHKGLTGFSADTTSGSNVFSLPPGFADFVEARANYTTGETVGQQDRQVTRVISRCGPEADSIALDFADALAPSIALAEPQGGMTKWTFPTPEPGQVGDVIIFDGVILPATQSSLLLPTRSNGGHVMLRIDAASANGYAEFKRTQRISLDLTENSAWCQGTDYVRVTRTEWPDP